MLKFMMTSFVATVASVCWIAQTHAAIVSTVVDCSSVANAYTECDAGGAFTDAKLVREDVAGSCVFGSTWGTYDHFIWVNHGCSGRFKVTMDSAVTPPPPPAPLPPTCPDVDCRFNSVNWQPYYRPTNHFVGLYHFGFRDAGICEAAIRMAHSNVVCNWAGNGFVPYDVETNGEVYHIAYPTLDACYASIP